jgi:hypothetical protein
MAKPTTLQVHLTQFLSAYANGDGLEMVSRTDQSCYEVPLATPLAGFYLLMAAAHAITRGVPLACVAFDDAVARSATYLAPGLKALRSLDALAMQIRHRLAVLQRHLAKDDAHCVHLPGFADVAKSCLAFLQTLVGSLALKFFTAEFSLPNIGGGIIDRDLATLLAGLQVAHECFLRSVRAHRGG